MAGQSLHKCDFIEITTDGQSFFIESFKQGFSLAQFNEIVSFFPQIRITSFTTIKSAIVFAPRPKEKFGELKERVDVQLSPDSMKAFIRLCVQKDELEYGNRNKLKNEIISKLAENGVKFGIKEEVLLGTLENQKEILVAEGEYPKNGKDSVVKIYEIKEAKPEVHEDGSVDHYELNLINRVKKGEWLGERVSATDGVKGKNVKGAEVAGIPGKNFILEYDRSSVYEVQEANKIVLYAMYDGAVSYKDGRVSVANHLEIDGNVDFATGNIDFEGCVTIKGTIDDNFVVVADGDIEVLGELGIGNVRNLRSRKGSIYIKGGISAKSKVTVQAAKNIYAKYVANASIMAGEMIHIGFYCINSDISAKEVLVDSSKSKIIGGTIIAEARVVANVIGSPSEKRTFINVKGINKKNIKNRIEEINNLLTPKKVELSQIKNELTSAASKKASSREIEKIKESLRDATKEIRELEEEKKSLGGYLKIHGDGEVVIQRKIYPNCFIEIKEAYKEVTKEQNSVIFYNSEGELKEA